MPASAVARRMPATVGMSGTCFGASGETEDDIAGALGGVWICRCPAHLTRRHASRLWPGITMLRYSWRQRSDSEFLLLRRRRHLAVSWLGISRLGIRGLGRVGRLGIALRRIRRRLVHAFHL